MVCPLLIFAPVDWIKARTKFKISLYRVFVTAVVIFHNFNIILKQNSSFRDYINKKMRGSVTSKKNITILEFSEQKFKSRSQEIDCLLHVHLAL